MFPNDKMEEACAMFSQGLERIRDVVLHYTKELDVLEESGNSHSRELCPILFPIHRLLLASDDNSEDQNTDESENPGRDPFIEQLLTLFDTVNHTGEGTEESN